MSSRQKQGAPVKVFAGNLSLSTDEAALRAFFAPVEAHILSVRVITQSHRTAGYGFVTVATQSAAEHAVARLHHKALDGKSITVQIAKPSEGSAKAKSDLQAASAPSGNQAEAPDPPKEPPPKTEQTDAGGGAKKESYSTVVSPSFSLETIAKSIASMESRLATVLTSLGDAQTRLVRLEATVVQTQADVLSGRQGVADLRNQLLALEESSSVTQQVGDRVPDIEARLEDMSTSFSSSEDRLSEVEGAVERTRDGVSVVQQLVATHSQILLTGKPSNAQDGTLKIHESYDSLQQQVSALDQRVPAVEAKSEKLARAFGQTLENLTSVHNYLQVTQQQLIGLDGRVPAVEAKAGRLAESLAMNREELSAMQLSLASTGERLNALDSRILTVEDKADELEKFFELARDPMDDGTSVPPSGRINDALLSSTRSSAAKPFPWLPLPRSLEDMT